MFIFDERIRGLPARREQVTTLYQSLNSPHVAIPGKPAGTAQAFIVGVRQSQGFGIYVYLYLSDAEDCAVYVSDQGALRPEDFAAAEGEAVAFVESMGFFMDTLNFRALPPEQQEELIETLPVFRREPARAPPKGKAPETRDALARFFASF